jgi:hypothetical protein
VIALVKDRRALVSAAIPGEPCEEPWKLALASKRAVYGFVTVRYEWEVAARASTEGAVWSILATFPLKPIRLP